MSGLLDKLGRTTTQVSQDPTGRVPQTFTQTAEIQASGPDVESGYGPVFCCTEGPGVSQAGASPHIDAVRLGGGPSQLCHLQAE